MEKDLKQKIIDLEIHLTIPKVRASFSELDRILSDDFLELTSAGTSYGKKQALERIPNEAPPQITASDFVIRELATNIIQLTYKAIIKGPDENNIRYSLRSSIWKKNDGDWQMEFHQGTPCQPM